MCYTYIIQYTYIYIINYSLIIRLLDVPYEPILHQPILGQCNTVNITWSPPTREALGDPITSYVAQIRSSGAKEAWINCTYYHTSKLDSCLFTHLKKFTEYSVRVLARNKLGYSLPSNIENILTRQAGRIIYIASITVFEPTKICIILSIPKTYNILIANLRKAANLQNREFLSTVIPAKLGR